MVYPNSNLPSASQPWGKAIQRDLEKVQATVASNEVNNKARDTQLEKNYKRLDGTVNAIAATTLLAQGAADDANAAAAQASSAASQASSAASQAQAAADTANANVTALSNVVAGNTALNGSGIIQGTLSASKITTGTLDASNVNVTNLNASNITAGELVGVTVKTQASGTRIQLSGTQVQVYDGSSLAATIGANSGGLYLYSNGNYIALNSGGASTNTSMSVGGTATLSGGGSFPGTNTFGGSIYYPGRVGSTTTGTPIHVRTSGANTNLLFEYTSSARYKDNITDLDIDYDNFTSIPVKSFYYKDDLEEFGDEAKPGYGFIAEDLHNAGYTDLVVYSEDENGNLIPHSLAFNSIAAVTQSLVNKQAVMIKELQATVQSLTDRIEALEGK
jgi:hypothetical protein